MKMEGSRELPGTIESDPLTALADQTTKPRPRDLNILNLWRKATLALAENARKQGDKAESAAWAAKAATAGDQYGEPPNEFVERERAR